MAPTPFTCEVVAIGTELLLGPSVDTNSTWIGEQLALSGIDSHFHSKVGDNRARIVSVLRHALSRSDAVVICGGLGPTHDDLTRDAIAEVMGVELQTEPVVADRIRALFEARGRPMADNNLRQAQVPEGSSVIEQRRGTAPGLICPVDGKVVYALPGVPHEMREMMERTVLPDLRRRSGRRSMIVSRVLRTWGDSESGLADRLHSIIEELDASPGVTLAFLASGIEGIRVRLTAKAPDREAALAQIAGVEAQVRAVLGNQVFGVDNESMEDVVLRLLRTRNLTLGVADALTGGLLAARLDARIDPDPPASELLRGVLVCANPKVRARLLGSSAAESATNPTVVRTSASEEGMRDAARAMAEGACRLFESTVGLSVLGEVRPGADRPPGTVYIGLHMDGASDAAQVRLPGDPEQLRKLACISTLNFLRLRLLGG